MQRIVLLLLGLASLAASGVILDRGHGGLYGMGGLGQQSAQGVTGHFGAGNVMTKNELLKQKFILEILQQIYVPLQQQDLLMLEDRNIITNEDLYVRPLTQDMQQVLDLIRSNQMLGKQAICSINNQQHVHQVVGLYRLFVNARDFDTFQRLAVYARQNVNNEMFVYSFIMSLGERQDTQMLIVPALHEILPQLFIKDRVIDQVRQLDTGVSTVRPQLWDVIGMGRRNLLLNSRIADQQQDGLLGILNRSQLWMPWRELHKQIAVSKMTGGNLVQQDVTQSDKVVITLPGSGLLSQDIGLKSYVGILVAEILLNQDTIVGSNTNYMGIGGQQSYIKGNNNYYGKQGQWTADNLLGATQNNRYSKNWYANSLYGNNLYTGGRGYNNVYGVNDELEQNTYGNRYGNLNQDYGAYSQGGKRYGSAYDSNDLYYGGSQTNEYMTSQNVPAGQNGIHTVSVNDPRLLFVGRRRQNPNSYVNVGYDSYQSGNNRYQVGNNQYDEDDYISGGRTVARADEQKQKNKYNKYNGNDDDLTLQDWNNERYTKYNKHAKMMDIYNEKENFYPNVYHGVNSKTGYQKNGHGIDNEQDYLYSNTYHGMKYHNYQANDMNSKTGYQNYQDNDYINRYSPYGYGLGQEGMGYGRTTDDFLNIVTRGRYGEKQAYDNEQGLMYNGGYIGQSYGEGLYKNLPTTDINDARLLYINRRKLNNGVEGLQVNNVDENDQAYNTRYNNAYQGYQRSNANNQRSYIDEQNYWDMIQHDNQNMYTGAADETRGHRYRRSIVNKELGQTSTINGKLLIHSLQQLVARLNIERIALGQPLLINTQSSIAQGFSSSNWQQQTGLSGTGNVGVQTINQIQNIIQHIDQVLQQRIGQVTIPSYNQKINEIGLILAGQIQDLGLTNILGDVLQQINPQQRKGLIVNMLENEAAQILLAGIVQVVDQKLQQIYLQREEFISTVQGVTINNVGVDKLQTYVEQTNVDLTNLVNNYNVGQTVQGSAKVVVGRVPRLNHKSFKIEIDVTSDQQQQVVVRNLLVPKVDGQDNTIPLAQRRQNVIVLDVTTAQLQPGRNTLKLNSQDITITSRDTTPLTKIYQLVMQALNGNGVLQQDILAGQSSLLPHRLLLPRGRPTGLPMQLITVITPLTGASGIMGIQKGAELNTLFLDNLPLNYPLHCDITNLDNVLSMPNLMVKNVQIYHEDNIKIPLMSVY